MMPNAAELAGDMLRPQLGGAHNINWASPTHVLPMLLDGLRMAYNDELHVPVAYDSSGSEPVSTLQSLDGFVDIVCRT